METVIITGANGFVGSQLSNHLTEQGTLVLAVVRNEQSDVSILNSNQNLKIIYCDLNTYSDLAGFIPKNQPIDAFYHFAWSGTSGNARADYGLQLNNAKATCDAVKVAKALKAKKFIFAGSIMEYECGKYIPLNEAKPGLGNIYSTGKVAAHYMARTLAYSIGLDFETLIISNIYGPGEKSVRLINATIKKLLNGEEAAFTEGKQLYDFIYITDAVKAMVLVGESGQDGHSYYIGNPEPKALRNFIEIIGEAVSPETTLHFGKVPFNGPMLTYKEFNTHALYEEFGFIPTVAFQEGIERTKNWLKKAGE